MFYNGCVDNASVSTVDGEAFIIRLSMSYCHSSQHKNTKYMQKLVT